MVELAERRGLGSNVLHLKSCSYPRQQRFAFARLDASRGKSCDNNPQHGLQPGFLIKSRLRGCLDMCRVNEDRDGVANGTRGSVYIAFGELPSRDPVGEDAANERRHAARVVQDEVRALLDDAPIERVHLRVVGKLGVFAAMKRQDKGRQSLGRRSVRLDEGFGQGSLLGHRCGGERVEDLGLGPEVPVDRRMRQSHRMRDIHDVRFRSAETPDQIPGGVEDAVALCSDGMFHAC